ncbi:vacuole membrane protein 1-like [Oscarella lobularis]|uniref:vacuole membrane protein 1-like n=1 Tax=Oscarella lobularis TaxID=121494 RepID=UPI003313B7A8
MDNRLYENYTVVQLRHELKRRHLPVFGKKALLIERLKEANETDQNSQNSAKAEIVEKNAEDSITAHRRRIELKERRSRLVLWRQPLRTLYYFALEMGIELRKLYDKLLHNQHTVTISSILFWWIFLFWFLDGPHQEYIRPLRGVLIWCLYWIGLGVLSSIGLGTGLHTFLLYLGPHIASVTLSAWECMSVDFPSPPYPDEIRCPSDERTNSQLSILTIMSKVRLEAFMWGFGTAIGELPPYFMARAARLSGTSVEEEEIEEELESLENTKNADLLTRAKRVIHGVVQRAGFIGILLCASIPNPLFDLAGITCGHFLIPFWTFFGATVIGKALIKMHIQKLFVIILFTKKYVEGLVDIIGYIPVFGEQLQSPFKEYLSKQREKLHQKPGQVTQTNSSWLTWFYERLVLVMVIYFVSSIINSMAQAYVKRMDDEEANASRSRNK